MYINSHYPFDNIKLSYSFSDLVPAFSYETLFAHYNNYYLKYLNNLNKILENFPALHNLSLDEILFNSSLLPSDLSRDITFYAGGVYNHQIYFESMGLNNKLMDSTLKTKLISTYGSIENFLTEFKSKALSLRGSGYVYLVCNEQNELSIFQIVNQDTTVPFNLCPLMCIDLWEHAYINDFGTDKEKYIDTFISLINWEVICSKYTVYRKSARKPWHFGLLFENYGY